MNNLDILLQAFKIEEYKTKLLPYVKETIAIKKEKLDVIPIGQSKIGGYPDVKEGFKFPSNDSGYLTFIMQVNLEEVVIFDKNQTLPQKGMLYFFFDTIEQPLFDDENYEKGWSVIYEEDTIIEELQRTEYPEDEDSVILNESAIRFISNITIPNPYEDISFNEHLDIEDREILDKIFSVHLLLPRLAHTDIISVILQDPFTVYKKPFHHLLGNAKSIQSDTLAECVDIYYKHRGCLLSNDELLEKTKGWTLLLQFDGENDDELDYEVWGKLYFYIKEEDLKNKQFHKTYLTWQCD